jgi:carnitine-CoA ligase
MIEIMGHEPHATNLRDLLIMRADYGDKPLLIIRDEVLTYADADRLSNRVANRLIEHGVGKGDVVATFMYNSIAQALIWFGCAKMGAVYAPLNVSLVRDDLAYSLNDTEAILFILDEELAPAYNAAKPLLTFDPKVLVLGETSVIEAGGALSFDDLLEGDEALPDIEIKGTDPMAIVYTGGSTSMPKGVLVSHLYYIAAAIRYAEIAEATDQDVHFANSHFFHIGGQQFAITGPLYNGMTGVMEKWFSASRYWDIARKHGATIVDPIGTMMAVLLRQPKSDLDRQHKVRVGVGVASGQVRGALHREFEERFGAPMLEVYAMTEVGVLICSERVNDRRENSSGKPHGWAEIMVVDQDDNPVPPNTMGHLLLRPSVINTYMIEYVNKPAETLAAWKNLWYHSGDLGYMDEDGYVYFIGREAHWVRRRGENVSAFEVEKALSEHPAVLDCAIVGVMSDVGDEDIKAYVHVTDGFEQPAPVDLVAWCRERIAYFKVPRYIEFVDGFPRTMTKNEIARHELRERGIGHCWDATVDAWIAGEAGEQS